MIQNKIMNLEFYNNIVFYLLNENLDFGFIRNNFFVIKYSPSGSRDIQPRDNEIKVETFFVSGFV